MNTAFLVFTSLLLAYALHLLSAVLLILKQLLIGIAAISHHICNHAQTNPESQTYNLCHPDE